MISVIVPCYNAAAYLPDCLDALCGQTVADVEIVLVDDGSTDDSLAIAEAYARREPRLVVLRLPHGGVSAARNAGLAAARGQIVTFADADDTLPPLALAALSEAVERGADIACGLIMEDNRDGQPYVLTPLRKLLTKDQQLRALIDGDRVLNSLCNKAYRRELVEHIRQRPGLAIGEDALFNLEAYARAGSTVLLPQVTYVYRMHAASAMHAAEDRARDFQRHLPWLEGVRGTLAALGLRERYFGAYLHSHTLRLYKAHGLFGVVAGFNRQVRPAALAGVRVKRLPPQLWPLYGLVKAGLYPLAYCIIGPAQIAGRQAAKLGRYVRHLPAWLRAKQRGRSA